MTKKLFLGMIFTQICFPKKFFGGELPLLDVIHCCQLSLYAISRKTNEPNLRKWQRTQIRTRFWLNRPRLGLQFFFLKNLPSSVTRYHDQLSSCTISEKTNDLILRKLSDGRTDGRTGRQSKVMSQEAAHLTSSVQ